MILRITTQTAESFWANGVKRGQEKEGRKARTSLINNIQKGLIVQCVVMMNQTHLSYGHSAAFYKDFDKECIL